MESFATRLAPGMLLKESLEAFRETHQFDAPFIAAAVGSLDVVRLRLAGAGQILERSGPHELVALSGTLSRDGVHLHAAVADQEGRVYGGHVLPGCRVYTTMELVIGNVTNCIFRRTLDQTTGYNELVVRP